MTPRSREAKDATLRGRGLLSIQEAAKLLGLSRARTYALVSDGQLTGERSGGAVYVSEAAIAAYKAGQSIPEGWVPLLEAMRRTGYSRTFFATHGLEKLRHRGRVLLRLVDVESVV